MNKIIIPVLKFLNRIKKGLVVNELKKKFYKFLIIKFNSLEKKFKISINFIF